MLYTDPRKCVDDVIACVGDSIVLGTPLGMGKPNHLLNAFYQRAKENPNLQLKIMTALTLEKPKGKSFLEKRFLDPLAERIYGDYPDLDYELDRMNNRLPHNVQVIEFYFLAGKYIHNKNAQRHYISSNYTHIAREMIHHQVNVLAQMICEGEVNDRSYYNLSCNPDVSLDILAYFRECKKNGIPVATVAQLNDKLPFMFGDAIIAKDEFEFVLDSPTYYFKPFSTPKMSVSDADYMIGLYASTLVKDDGELQIGIGALGDALVYALKTRQENNDAYLQMLRAFGVEEKFGSTITRLGDTAVFKKGLLGATEMLVDGFQHLWESGILKRKVYDDLIIQRLLNEGAITEEVTVETLDLLLQRHAIHPILTENDFLYLQKFGILNGPQQLRYYSGTLKLNDGREIPARLDDDKIRNQIESYCLGINLKNGAVIHAGFFLGPQSFYQWLKDLPIEQRQLLHMKSVKTINQLYGHEEIDRLHRKNARFVNTCLMMTLLGATVSDGLEDGTVISGVGGQYNFVAMAHELPDGNSIIQLRSTREEGSTLTSNIVWNYGHATIPRHLRDIIITEYGIAAIRGLTDEDIIKALLNITDSRFQQMLLAEAKKAGKLSDDYRIPEPYRNNFPERYKATLVEFRRSGFFPAFPFGTDFTAEEIVLGKTLKSLKKETTTLIGKLITFLKAVLPQGSDEPLLPFLKRMNLDHPKSNKEKIYQRLLVNALRKEDKTKDRFSARV